MWTYVGFSQSQHPQSPASWYSWKAMDVIPAAKAMSRRPVTRKKVPTWNERRPLKRRTERVTATIMPTAAARGISLQSPLPLVLVPAMKTTICGHVNKCSRLRGTASGRASRLAVRWVGVAWWM